MAPGERNKMEAQSGISQQRSAAGHSDVQVANGTRTGCKGDATVSLLKMMRHRTEKKPQKEESALNKMPRDVAPWYSRSLQRTNCPESLVEMVCTATSG